MTSVAGFFRFGFALMFAAVPTRSPAADIQQLLTENRVPAVSIAVVRKGKIVEVMALGVRNVTTGTPVDADTVFSAASLSKPVFAYAVMQLVDAGLLSLDAPLASYVPNFVSNDPRAADITVRNALSHTTGLPNWRNAKQPLKTHFQPGERFSYSGEAFVWLQRAVEAKTGEPFDATMQRLVFGPLGMRRSSFVWRPEFNDNYADPHDADLVPAARGKPTAANAGGSLQTTASDYARFMIAVMYGRRLQKATRRAWLEPQVRLQQQCFQCIEFHGIRRRPARRLGPGLGLGTGCRHLLPLG